LSFCIAWFISNTALCGADTEANAADSSSNTTIQKDDTRQPTANQPTSIPTATPPTTLSPADNENALDVSVEIDGSDTTTTDATTDVQNPKVFAVEDQPDLGTMEVSTPNSDNTNTPEPIAMPDNDAARRAIAGIPIASSSDAQALGTPSKSLGLLGKPNSESQLLVTSTNVKSSWISSYIPGGYGTLKSFGALAVVIGLIFLLKPIIRKLGGPMARTGGPSGVMEILAKYPFVKGQVFVLVKIDRRILLLCQTTQGSTTLSEFSDPDEVASLLRRLSDDEGDSFNHRLEQLLHGKNRSSQTALDPEYSTASSSTNTHDPFSLLHKKQPKHGTTSNPQHTQRDVVDLTKCKRRWPRLTKRSLNDAQTIPVESNAPGSTSSLEIQA